MPAVLRTPKGEWIAEASRALGDQGVDSVRIESLAATMGVTKGSFYAHFSNRAELLNEILNDWERRSTDDVLERVRAIDTNPSTNIRLAGLLTFGDDLHQVDLAVRHWARTDPKVQERLLRVDGARLAYLRAQFRRLVDVDAEVEARTILAFTFAIGRHFLPVEDGTATANAATEHIGSLLGL